MERGCRDHCEGGRGRKASVSGSSRRGEGGGEGELGCGSRLELVVNVLLTAVD